ncbi:MAG: GNAT family N-acetyltransferase [Geminicoccaceae bacterium]
MHLRPAVPDDAPALAELIDLAGEGLPLHLWAGMAEPGETAWEVGRRRARREVGGFSWRNATMAEAAGSVVACLIGYPLPEASEPIDLMRTPPMFVPMEQLERLAPGSWYINVLATYPDFRGQGLGTRLIGHAGGLAAAAGCRGTSIIVADTNDGARRLYERTGHVERARRAAVKADWDGPVREWVLLVRD